jgi:hypothetical protein
MTNGQHELDVAHLAAFDTDGALQETAARANRTSRRRFLAGAGAAIGGAGIIGALPAAARAQGGTSQGDVAILNFALTLEYLEAAFYREALDGRALNGELRRFARITGQHEDAHVSALRDALGSAAVARPRFDFKGTTENRRRFVSTAIVLEDTGVEAYQGQAPLIQSKALLRAAISIHPVEARHAAWIRSIANGRRNSPSPAPRAFNPARTRESTLRAVTGTGFIVG